MNKPVVFTFNFKMIDSKRQIIESTQKNSLSVIEGKQQVFGALGKALLKLKPGDRKRIAVNSKEAFGENNTDLVVQVPQAKFNELPRIGDVFNMDGDNGSPIKMTVVDEKHGLFILDGNHFLAGVDLFFEIDFIKQRPATSEEGRTGKVI